MVRALMVIFFFCVTAVLDCTSISKVPSRSARIRHVTGLCWTVAPPGTEVHGKIHCDDHAMGYSLFYGVFEFVYEKVVFFF